MHNGKHVDPLRNQGKRWSDEDKALLVKLYPDESNANLARIFGRSLRSIKSEAAIQGLRKSQAHMDTKPGCYKPGNEPWSKGRHMPVRGRAVETQFKKGHQSHTWRPIGHEMMVAGYLNRKVADGGLQRENYRPVHHLVWEEHHGRPIPKGHALAFRDGDRRNFDPDNLELITRAELARRNSIHRYPPEIRDVMRLKGRITRKINRLEKERQHENQD